MLIGDFSSSKFQTAVALINAQSLIAHSQSPELNTPIVILSSAYPSTSLQLMLKHPSNLKRVHFFLGTSQSTKDLERVKAANACAILIFSDKYATSSKAAADVDKATTTMKSILTVNFIKADLNARIRQSKLPLSVAQDKAQFRPVIISQSYAHESCLDMLDHGVDRVISIMNTKYSLIAHETMFPGFLAVFSALITYYPLYKHNSIHEFDYGLTFEMMEIPIKNNCSKNMKKLSFSLLNRLLYHLSEGKIVCCGVYNYKQSEAVLLNPHRYVKIGDCESIFLMANDIEKVLQLLGIENIRPLVEKFFQHHTARPLHHHHHRHGHDHHGRNYNVISQKLDAVPEVSIGADLSLVDLVEKSEDSNLGENPIDSNITPQEGDFEFKRRYTVASNPAHEMSSLNGDEIDSCFTGSESAEDNGPISGLRSSSMAQLHSHLNAHSVDIQHHHDESGVGHGTDESTFFIEKKERFARQESLKYYAVDYANATKIPQKRGKHLINFESPIFRQHGTDSSVIYVCTYVCIYLLSFLFLCAFVLFSFYIISNILSSFTVMYMYICIVVIVCAFSPKYPIANISDILNCFLSSTRTRSDDEVIILVENADMIQTRMSNKIRRDGRVFYRNGHPDDIENLKVLYSSEVSYTSNV